LRPPEAAQLIDQNRAQPGSEFPFQWIVLEARDLADDHFEDLLHDVVGIVRLRRLGADPRGQQWPVELIESMPGCLIVGMLAQAFQQALGRVGHVALSLDRRGRSYSGARRP